MSYLIVKREVTVSVRFHQLLVYDGKQISVKKDEDIYKALLNTKSNESHLRNF